MPSKPQIPAARDYPGTGENRARHADKNGDRSARADRTEPTIRVELVVVDGPEGQKLHAIQAEVIHRILTRPAERQIQTPQKASRL